MLGTTVGKAGSASDVKLLKSVLSETPVFLFNSEIGGDKSDELLEFLVSCLEAPEGEFDKVKIYVQTMGGCCYTTNGLIDMIGLLKAKVDVEIIASAVAMSGGVALVTSGTIGCRKATKNLRMMLHPVQVQFPPLTSENASIEADEIAFIRARYIESIVENSSLEDKDRLREELSDILSKNMEYYFGPEKAISWGLLDEVI